MADTSDVGRAGVRIETVTIDCDDPELVSRFWASLLGYRVEPHPTASVRIRPPDGDGPHLLFTPAGRPRRGMNPWHLDLRPDDRSATVERALELGATLADVGQTGEESWVVLADPEGNEFCVLQSPADLARWKLRRDDERDDTRLDPTG